MDTAEKARVLVIDGDPDTLRLIDIKLRRAGFQVLTSMSGDDGLALGLAWRPDVLLAEAELAGRDGGGLISELKRRLGLAAPIAILMSQRGAEDDIRAGLALGADDYVVKPFSPRELLIRVTVALARARLSSTPSMADAALAEREA